MLVTGGLRRVHVRGQEEIRKRLLIQAAAFNLGLLMRQRYGIGTPRGLQGLAAARAVLSRHAGSAISRFFCSFCLHMGLFGAILGFSGRRIRLGPKIFPISALVPLFHPALWKPISSTGCYVVPELDIVTYFPARPAASEIDAASQALFESAMTAEDAVFVSVLSVSGAVLGARNPGVRCDKDPVRVLRSVLMRPEQEALAPSLVQRLDTLAQAL